MERKRRKALNFDLDTNRMKELGLYPDGYRRLGRSFYKYGFEHRQGSGYLSIEKITDSDVQFALKNVIRENVWLTQCTNKIDVTDVGRQHDLTAMIESFASESVSVSTPLRKPNNKTTKKELQPKDKDIVARIRSSKMGADFNRLYEGKYIGEKSVADKKLVSILSFFTNGDNTQIQRIFETSKLYEPTKGSGFISEALSAEARSRAALTKSNASTKNRLNSWCR